MRVGGLNHGVECPAVPLVAVTPPQPGHQDLDTQQVYVTLFVISIRQTRDYIRIDMYEQAHFEISLESFDKQTGDQIYVDKQVTDQIP